MKDIKGIIPVLITPFTEEGAVDVIAFKNHIRNLINQGVHGVIPGGSTGEFAGLTEEEHKLIIDAAIEEVNGEIPVIAGTAAVSTAQTIKMTKYAVEAGADAVMIVAPYYCHPNDEEIYGHYKALSEAVETTFVLYNNPGTSGVDMEPELIARIAELPNFDYIKESTGDMTRATEIMRRCGDKMKILCGCDTLALEMFMLGAVGWVSPPSNLIPSECVELYQKTVVEKEWEKAKTLYFKLLPLFSMFENTGKYIQLTKAGLALQGKPVGVPRLPLLESPKASQEELQTILNSIKA
jgi:4-hydroxy-tetrahydrodipicolinate synthase